MIKVENLSVSFNIGGTEKKAVRGVSFSISRGETIALVGESGSGKTVTALSILQLLPYPTAFHPSGSIKIDGVEVVGADDSINRSIRGNKISMIFQEPMTSLNPLHTIEKQIGETLLLHRGLRGEKALIRIVELLELVGLKNPETRIINYPHQFSGGERQRIMIAMALANEPNMLIADEPTTALDVTIQAQILKLLSDLQKKFDMAILLISHDLAVVRKIADRVCVMTDGRIVEIGNTEDIFTSPQHAYTKHLLSTRPTPKETIPDPDAPVIISTKDLSVHFPVKGGLLWRTKSYVRAVEKVSLSVKEGHTLGIVGESGSGKTTLGFALLRLEKSKGIIQFEDKKIQGWTFKKMRPLRQDMQIVFQDPFSSLNPRHSVGQIIEEGLLVHNLGGDAKERKQSIRDTLEEVGIEPDAEHRYPHEFSGGQRQRIAIARAIILKPKLIVLDEPTSSLDISTQAQIIDLLRKLQDKHKLTYIFISHDLQVVRALCDEILVMKAVIRNGERIGEVVEIGPAQQIIDCPQSDYTRALMKAAFELETVEGDDINT